MNIIGQRVKAAYLHGNFEGVLITFGISFDELRDGIAHYTTAIILLDNGSIYECPVTCITFENKA